jgi:hypothetical protein
MGAGADFSTVLNFQQQTDSVKGQFASRSRVQEGQTA